MTKTSLTIRTGSAVRLIDEHDDNCGRIGEVTSISRDKTMLTVRLLQTADKVEVLVKKAQYCFRLDRDIDANELVRLQAIPVARAAKAQADMEAYVAKRNAQAVAKYVAERTTPVAPLVREARSHGTIWGEQRNGYISDSITIYPNGMTFGVPVPNVTVNWSACGSVSPEEALAFAQSLAAAAIEAMAIRAQKEQDLGITIC